MCSGAEWLLEAGFRFATSDLFARLRRFSASGLWSFWLASYSSCNKVSDLFEPCPERHEAQARTAQGFGATLPGQAARVTIEERWTWTLRTLDFSERNFEKSALTVGMFVLPSVANSSNHDIQ